MGHSHVAGNIGSDAKHPKCSLHAPCTMHRERINLGQTVTSPATGQRSQHQRRPPPLEPISGKLLSQAAKPTSMERSR